MAGSRLCAQKLRRLGDFVVWYLAALGLVGALFLATASLWLVIPVLGWTIAYIGFLASSSRKIRRGSRNIAYARSDMVGRIVDSYTIS